MRKKRKQTLERRKIGKRGTKKEKGETYYTYEKRKRRTLGKHKKIITRGKQHTPFFFFKKKHETHEQ